MPIAEGTSIGTVVIGPRIQTDYAELYLGRQPGLERRVAVRVLPAAMRRDRAVVERLQRESYLSSRVAHPNLVQAYDSFTIDGDQFLVMEYVEGSTLTHAIDRELEATPEVAASIVLEIARGLEELHAAGVYHTALRPGNVLISKRGRIKLKGLDHGRDAREDPVGDASQRAPYDAPEFTRGEPLGPACDTYSLGVLLADLLAEPSSGWSTRLERSLRRLSARCCGPDPAGRPGLRPLRMELERLLPDASPTSCRITIGSWLAGSQLPRASRRAPEEEFDDAVDPYDAPVAERSWYPLAIAGLVLLSVAVFGVSSWLGRSDEGPAPVAAAPVGPPALVVFDASPWAEIQVDEGVPFLTPRATPIELSAGSHEVIYRHPSFGEARETLILGEGEELVVRHVFEAGNGS